MPFPLSNLLLEALPDAAKAAVLSRLEPVPLPLGSVLYEAESDPKYVHFLTSGMASIVTTMTDGDAVEVGVVGREGLAEAFQLLGPIRGQSRCYMQVPGSGFRMSFKAFKQHFFREEMLHLVLRYAQYQGMVLGQLAACNRLHEVEERLARWLLMVNDRLGVPELPLTQDFLSYMLGSRRSTVTIMAGTLQRGGLIEYQRGKVRILDRENLESAACECYGVTRKLFGELYNKVSVM